MPINSEVEGSNLNHVLFSVLVEPELVKRKIWFKTKAAGGRESKAREEMEKKGFDTQPMEAQMSTINLRVLNSQGRPSEFIAEHIHLWMACYKKRRLGSTQKKSNKWSTPSGSNIVRKMKGCAIYCRMLTINMSVSI